MQQVLSDYKQNNSKKLYLKMSKENVCKWVNMYVWGFKHV